MTLLPHFLLTNENPRKLRKSAQPTDTMLAITNEDIGFRPEVA